MTEKKCNCENHDAPMTAEEKRSAMMGLLGMLLVLGLVVTSILQFFGGSFIFPNLFLVGIIAMCVYYAKRSKGAKKGEWK